MTTTINDLSASARWLLKLCCDRPVSVRGVGAGAGVAAIARGLERRGLITIDRRHWRDHDARATPAGRKIAASIPSTQLRNDPAR